SVEEEFGNAHPLVRSEKDPLAGRAERENPVDAAAVQELEIRREDPLVELAPVLAKRRQRGSVRLRHAQTLSSGGMSALRVERDGPVLRVTLAKPERRNAFDAALIAELTEAFEDVGDPRAVVLAGEGESFCAPTALRIGLVSEVAPDLDGALERVVGELLTSGPEAVHAAKQLIRERPGGEETAQIAARLRAGDEGQAGLRAFLDNQHAPC